MAQDATLMCGRVGGGATLCPCATGEFSIITNNAWDRGGQQWPPSHALGRRGDCSFPYPKIPPCAGRLETGMPSMYDLAYGVKAMQGMWGYR